MQRPTPITYAAVRSHRSRARRPPRRPRPARAPPCAARRRPRGRPGRRSPSRGGSPRRPLPPPLAPPAPCRAAGARHPARPTAPSRDTLSCYIIQTGGTLSGDKHLHEPELAPAGGAPAEAQPEEAEEHLRYVRRFRGHFSGGVNAKVQSFTGEWRRKLRTHRRQCRRAQLPAGRAPLCGQPRGKRRRVRDDGSEALVVAPRELLHCELGRLLP
jgi:hypothetical protein